jgi:predicted RND superfamily exporter protein
MAEFFTGRYRWTILVAVVLLSGFAVSQYSSLRINPGFEDYLPAHISNRAGMDSLSRVFGGNERALVMLQHPEGVLSARHLQALADLSRAFMAMEGVAQCRSLLDVSEPQLDEEGFTTIVPLVDPATLTGTDAVLQKERLRQHPLARRFIAADFSTSALIVTRSPDSDDGAFTEGLRELGSRHAHGGVLHYGGQAFLRQSVKHYIQRDLLLLMPLSLTVMLLLLYFSFREWEGVLLPFLVVALSLVIAFGFMGLMSWELSLVSVLLRTVPEVGHVLSPDLFFRELSKGLYGPEEGGYNALPASSNEARQYVEVAALLGYGGELSQLLSTDYRQARILVSLRDGSNATGKKVLQAIDAISSDDPDRVLVAGPGLSKIALAEMVIKGQLISLIMSLLIVFFLLTLSFKSWAAGTQGTLSLLLAILFLFGIMGFTGISLDLVTALLSSVMIGVGIDYTIHFLWRYRKEYARCLNSDQALATTLLTAGRGIVFNAFSVMLGFSVLMLSGFTPLRFFGILVVAALMACLLSALLLVPALIKLSHPRFLEPQMD